MADVETVKEQKFVETETKKELVKREGQKIEEKKEVGKEEKKREIVMERVYTVSLLEAQNKPRMKRANVAMKMLRAFLKRHMKSGKINVTNSLNSLVRGKGAKPPKRVKVKASKDKEGTVLAEAAK